MFTVFLLIARVHLRIKEILYCYGKYQEDKQWLLFVHTYHCAKCMLNNRARARMNNRNIVSVLRKWVFRKKTLKGNNQWLVFVHTYHCAKCILINRAHARMKK